jgi:hypothetical protein
VCRGESCKYHKENRDLVLRQDPEGDARVLSNRFEAMQFDLRSQDLLLPSKVVFGHV